jgi:hypothetical protein
MKKVLIVLFLISQISIIAQDYKFGKVSKAELEEKFYPLDSTANAAYLYKSEDVYFEYAGNQGWSLVKQVNVRLKIYNKKGFLYATKDVHLYKTNGKREILTQMKAFTYNLKEGKIVKDKLSKKSIFTSNLNKNWSKKEFTMPSVNSGCIIEYKYKVISPFYYNLDQVIVQEDIPIKESKINIKIPEYFTFKTSTKGYLTFYLKKSVEQRKISYSYRVKAEGKIVTKGVTNEVNLVEKVYKLDLFDVPALKKEVFVSNIDNYRSKLIFELSSIKFPNSNLKAYSTTWEDVSKQIYKSSRFGSELEKSNYYKNDLATVLATAKTDLEKLTTIFQFAKNKVKWNNYKGIYTDKGVKKAYKERAGNVADINLMLTSMLRSAGLNANPILLSTRTNGVPLFPTIDGFNYVIAMVDFEDGTYALLDATEPYSLPNILPVRALNWNGRKVTKDGTSSWIKLTSSKHALEENNVMIKISDELLVEGMIRTKYSNLNALNFRKNNNHLTKEELITTLEEKEVIEIDNFKILNKENLAKPIVRNLRFNSDDLIEEINGKFYIEPLLFLTEQKNPFKLEDRKFPVDFATPWKKRNIVSIQIPTGYKVEKLPKPLTIALPENLGVFKYHLKQNGNKINVGSILQFNSPMIAAQYYSALKQFYGEVVKKQAEKIVLVKE